MAKVGMAAKNNRVVPKDKGAINALEACKAKAGGRYLERPTMGNTTKVGQGDHRPTPSPPRVGVRCAPPGLMQGGGDNLEASGRFRWPSRLP